LGLAPSFGFGDRIGLATSGHLAALQEAGGPIRGIFAQQSIREMTRTRRTPEEVMSAAVGAVESGGYALPWGADADHLKTPEDVRRTVSAGFTFFTLDPSEDVDQRADRYDRAELERRFAAVRDEAAWVDDYAGRKVRLSAGSIEFDRETVRRAAVKYGRAIRSAIALAQCVERESVDRAQPPDVELSVDETPEPTTPAEHFIIADQLRQAGVKLASLAPRLVGSFEKGVDYVGDLAALEAQLRMHAAIADEAGPYKLSLHSGSDKLSMYAALARATRGRFHVKTAGTSYLEALRVVVRRDAALFREIAQFARRRFDRDKITYHVSARVDSVPAPEDVADPETLERLYLDRWEATLPGRGFTQLGRQILHCTFGSVLTDDRLGPLTLDVVRRNLDLYAELLREHFVRHLAALRCED
jgi:hypothetical protein